jgi:hypothetical protein
MKKLLTRKEIRWWFRSRQSGLLNLLSYWLIILCISTLISLVIGALWRVLVEEYKWLHQASEYSDWVYATPPNGLKAYKAEFEKKRNELISRVTQGDQNQIEDANQLIMAENIRKGMIPTGKAGAMFGKSDILVYPYFATYSTSKRRDLTEVEKTIFRNFAAHAINLYKSIKEVDPTHIERALAGALSLSSPSTDRATFDVPWIYVASNTGAIAVFPGATVIAEESWTTTSRPWFRGALLGDSQLVTKGLFESDLLTVTYLDVLARSPMLVRTYIYKFTIKGEDFVIGIDLKLRDEEVSGVTPSVFNAKPDYSSIFLSALSPKELLPVDYIAFVISALLFAIFRWMSSTEESKLTFERKSSALGKVKMGDVMRVQKEEQTSKQEKLGIGFEKNAGWSNEITEKETDSTIGTINIEKTYNNLRGYELWEVSQYTTTLWGLLWIRFESTKTIEVGTISLKYSHEIFPEASWVRFNELAFSKNEKDNLMSKLQLVLQRNADMSSDTGTLDIPSQTADLAVFLSHPDVPDWVRAVKDPKELLAIRQRRAYVRLSAENLDELYSISDVKAVMASGYFEQLLNRGQTDLLLKGKTIFRIISFPDQAATLSLTDKAYDKLKDLTERYSSASSRSLKGVNVPIDLDNLKPVYDFVILNDSSVIVAHFISQATGIDNASGRHTTSTYYVEGYMSWRPSDIKYYHDIFNQLAAGQLRELYSFVHKVTDV